MKNFLILWKDEYFIVNTNANITDIEIMEKEIYNSLDEDCKNKENNNYIETNNEKIIKEVFHKHNKLCAILPLEGVLEKDE